jgi:hypothetical protein
MDDGTVVSYVLAQVAIARWCLDGATASHDERAHHNLHRARQAYEIVEEMLPHLTAGGEQHQQLQEEVSALRSRLQAVGEFV